MTILLLNLYFKIKSWIYRGILRVLVKNSQTREGKKILKLFFLFLFIPFHSLLPNEALNYYQGCCKFFSNIYITILHFVACIVKLKKFINLKCDSKDNGKSLKLFKLLLSLSLSLSIYIYIKCEFWKSNH